MMTEDEAGKVWCRFARVVIGTQASGRAFTVVTGQSAYNRIALSENSAVIPDGSRCLASRCMAWRWDESAQFKSRADLEFSKTGKRLQPDQGYCGLAGGTRQ